MLWLKPCICPQEILKAPKAMFLKELVLLHNRIFITTLATSEALQLGKFNFNSAGENKASLLIFFMNCVFSFVI